MVFLMRRGAVNNYAPGLAKDVGWVPRHHLQRLQMYTVSLTPTTKVDERLVTNKRVALLVVIRSAGHTQMIESARSTLSLPNQTHNAVRAWLKTVAR